MNEVLAGLLEATFLFAPAILCLLVLCVWLGWRPVPPRGTRAGRFALAMPVTVLGVMALYLLGVTTGQAGSPPDGVWILLTPAAVFFVVGAAAVAGVYFGREAISIGRLIAAWVLSTFAVAALVIAVTAATAAFGIVP